jgi:hypothetical protein
MELTLPDGGTYTGETAENIPHGQGKAVWPDGKTYEGSWENGKMHGLGTMTWPDGKKYEGDFKDGEIFGFGTYSYPDGRKITGEWQGERKEYSNHPTKVSTKDNEIRTGAITLLRVVGYFFIVAGIICAILIWAELGTSEVTRGYLYTYTEKELNPVGIGLGLVVLVQGTGLGALFLVISQMAEDLGEIKRHISSKNY